MQSQVNATPEGQVQPSAVANPMNVGLVNFLLAAEQRSPPNERSYHAHINYRGLAHSVMRYPLEIRCGAAVLHLLHGDSDEAAGVVQRYLDRHPVGRIVVDVDALDDNGDVADQPAETTTAMSQLSAGLPPHFQDMSRAMSEGDSSIMIISGAAKEVSNPNSPPQNTQLQHVLPTQQQDEETGKKRKRGAVSCSQKGKKERVDPETVTRYLTSLALTPEELRSLCHQRHIKISTGYVQVNELIRLLAKHCGSHGVTVEVLTGSIDGIDSRLRDVRRREEIFARMMPKGGGGGGGLLSIPPSTINQQGTLIMDDDELLFASQEDNSLHVLDRAPPPPPQQPSAAHHSTTMLRHDSNASVPSPLMPMVPVSLIDSQHSHTSTMRPAGGIKPQLVGTGRTRISVTARCKEAAASKSKVTLKQAAAVGQVTALMDVRERVGGVRSKAVAREYLEQAFQEKQVRCCTTHLLLGDYGFLVAAPDRSVSGAVAQLMLPVVIERKAEEDLVASVKDGRYAEQKLKLKRTEMLYVAAVQSKMDKLKRARAVKGLPPPRFTPALHEFTKLYLVEHDGKVRRAVPNWRQRSGHGFHSKPGTDIKKLNTSRITNTMVNGFGVLEAASTDATVQLIGLVTKCLEHQWTSMATDDDYELLMSLAEFTQNVRSVETRVRAQLTFPRMLFNVEKVSEELAIELANCFGSARSLFNKWDQEAKRVGALPGNDPSKASELMRLQLFAFEEVRRNAESVNNAQQSIPLDEESQQQQLNPDGAETLLKVIKKNKNRWTDASALLHAALMPMNY